MSEAIHCLQSIVFGRGTVEMVIGEICVVNDFILDTRPSNVVVKVDGVGQF